MVLFLICTVPCVSILYIRALHRRFFDTGEVKVAFLYGILAQLIAMIPVFVLYSGLSFTYTPASLFLADWIKEFLVYWLVGLLLMILMRRRIFRLPTERGRWAETLAFWGGYFMLSGLFHTIYHFPGYTLYRLFFFPLLHLILWWAAVMGTHVLLTAPKLFLKVLGPALVTAFTLVLALVPYSFSINYDLWGFISFFLVLIFSGLLVYLVETKKLPIIGS